MNESNPATGTWLVIDERNQRRIDEDALKLCKGDAALWQHHRALLEGEFRIWNRGGESRRGWVLVQRLPQYKAAEASVIHGWRKLVATTLRLPREQQADDYAVNRAIIFDGCRRARDEKQVSEILKERAQSIHSFAASGDVRFFRSLGRMLNLFPHSSLRAFDYAHTMLSQWLTGFLWLMPERTASDCLADWCGRKPKTALQGDRELRHFKETKHDYKLKSHRPSLVNHMEADGTLVLTLQGRSVFNSLTSSK
jgi:hypothetical protein